MRDRDACKYLSEKATSLAVTDHQSGRRRKAVAPIAVPSFCAPGVEPVSYTHLDVYKRQRQAVKGQNFI